MKRPFHVTMISLHSAHPVRYVKTAAKRVRDKERKATSEMHPMSPGTRGAHVYYANTAT